MRLRQLIATKLPSYELSGEVEADESYFGGVRKGRRVRGATGKAVVFGLLKRGGKVYTAIIPDAKTESLLPIIREKVEPHSLVCMDGFTDAKGQILVLADTNRPDALDPAILRPGRFDETIRIETPDAKAREQKFRKRLGSLPTEPEILDAIPRLICRTAGMSLSEVDRVLREAAYMAARENRSTLTLADLEAATNLVRYGANRRDMVVSEKDRRLTAWHEAGHAIARLTLFPESKLDYLSIVPNEAGALGFAAWQADESKHSYSAEDYRNLIIVALAGREAEKFCPGAGSDAINTGVSSDYERATALAWDAVVRYGFDEKFGIMSISATAPYTQEALTNNAIEAVGALLASCLNEARSLTRDKNILLGLLANILIKKDAIDGSEIIQLIGISRPTT